MSAELRNTFLLLTIVMLSVMAIVAVPPAYATATVTGCCMPNQGAEPCFTGGGSYTDQASFNSACTDMPGTMVPGVTTCTGVLGCEVGCCCATANVPNSAQINNDESALTSTKNACTRKSTPSATYSYKPLNKPTCTEVCGGTTSGGGAATHKVTGQVYNATGSKPLEKVNVFVPVPSGYISAVTGADGKFTLTDVPQINTHIFAIHPKCRPGQSPAVLVDKDINIGRIDLNCQLAGCVHSAPTITVPKAIRGTSQVTFTAAVTDTCQDFVQYEPMRCDGQWKNCISLPPQTAAEIKDSGLKNDTTYCYGVVARFNDGTFTNTSNTGTTNCIKTGSTACMGLPASSPTSWCGMSSGASPAPSVLTCDDKNQLQVVKSCGAKTCALVDGTPDCVDAADCQQCNGLLGFFAKLGLKVDVGGLNKVCGSETPMCYMESATSAGSVSSRPLMIDAYSSCLQVSGCINYGKKEACEANSCGVGDGSGTACEWKIVSEELGKGICTPKGTPACRSCEAALGYCDAQACSLISPDCYFDADPNGLSSAQGCIPKSEMACRYYDTKSDCVGTGGNAAFDVKYNAAGARIGPTNARTTASNDKFGIGACTWVESKKACIKDADMKRGADNEDDCIESNVFSADRNCVRDSTPPKTTFFARNPAVYGRPEVRSLPFSVVDDTTPTDLVKTFICFKNASNDCYPNETMANIALPGEGSYELRYYSMDKNGNIEPVQNNGGKQIMIKDYHQAALDKMSIEENKDN